jgi:hypothetical protein
MLAEAYKERAKRINKKATGLRDYLKSVMEVLGRHKIETPEVTLAVRKNPAAVVIDDATIVPRSFKSTPPSFADVIFAPPPDTSPDKKAIVDALKAYAALVEKIPAGEAIPATPVPGARLTVATRLEVKI